MGHRPMPPPQQQARVARQIDGYFLFGRSCHFDVAGHRPWHAMLGDDAYVAGGIIASA